MHDRTFAVCYGTEDPCSHRAPVTLEPSSGDDSWTVRRSFVARGISLRGRSAPRPTNNVCRAATDYVDRLDRTRTWLSQFIATKRLCGFPKSRLLVDDQGS